MQDSDNENIPTPPRKSSTDQAIQVYTSALIEDPEHRNTFFQGLTVNLNSCMVKEDGPLSKYKQYEIKLAKEGFSQSVFRRYKEFAWLEEQLIDQYPGFIVPTIPSKSLTSKFNVEAAQTLRYRMARFQHFLRRIVEHPDLSQSDLVYKFLTLSSAEFAIFQNQHPTVTSPERDDLMKVGFMDQIKDTFKSQLLNSRLHIDAGGKYDRELSQVQCKTLEMATIMENLVKNWDAMHSAEKTLLSCEIGMAEESRKYNMRTTNYSSPSHRQEEALEEVEEEESALVSRLNNSQMSDLLLSLKFDLKDISRAFWRRQILFDKLEAKQSECASASGDKLAIRQSERQRILDRLHLISEVLCKESDEAMNRFTDRLKEALEIYLRNEILMLARTAVA